MTLRDHHRPIALTALLLATLLGLAACGRQAEEEATGAPPPAAAPASAGVVDGELPLPEFTDCDSQPPDLELPAKWQARALLQSFFMNALVFGDFVYDESAAAFRFTLTSRYDLKELPGALGVEAGTTLDFLVTEDRELYLLEGGEAPTGCTWISDQSPFTVPSRNWLTGDAVACVGEAPILDRDQQWWKVTEGDGANWFWYNTDDRLPFRSMYYERTQDPAPVYEQFTFNYFPSFEEVAETGLPELLELCEGSTSPRVAEEAAKPVLDLGTFMDVEPEAERRATPNAEQIAVIQDWIPGISECTSPTDLPPPWPDQVQISVFFTAVNPDFNPFPSRVYYDWTRDPQAQNSSLYNEYPVSLGQYDLQVALLTGDSGYNFFTYADGRTTCSQDLPGPQVPDWQAVDGCECRAQLAPGTVLNPSAVPTKVLWCLIQPSGPPQVFWTWYSNDGTPVVFMQSNSSPTAGTGLNLADYTGWLPGSVAPEGTFDVPPECDGQQPQSVPQACHRCHLPVSSGTS